MTDSVINVRDLHRTYRTSTGMLRRQSIEVEAVRGVSLEVRQRELFGLLGPNCGVKKGRNRLAGWSCCRGRAIRLG